MKCAHLNYNFVRGGKNGRRTPPGTLLSSRASEFKSEDPGFDPLAGQGEGQFFCPSESTLVQTYLCLNPPRVYGASTHICALVKDPTSICRKRAGLTAGGRFTLKYYTH